MADLLHHLTLNSASTPIVVQGNTFYRGSERWLAKGISYHPYPPGNGSNGDKIMLDALADDRLHELEDDVAILHDLGLNAISVRHLDPEANHTAALKLLEKEGIYVLITIFDGLHKQRSRWPTENVISAEDYIRQQYNAETMISNLRLADKLADHPNVLGFVVSGSSMSTVRDTKVAEIMRACVRDTKAFLEAREKRRVPVGSTMSDLAMLRLPFLQYFSSGPPSEQADFAAIDCYSWAGKSSFQISGWKNMVERISKTTELPLMLSAFGANTTRPRRWDELLCLYSPDMTGVFSGGFAYTFFENGNGYGIVSVEQDGYRKPAGDFDRFKKHFKAIDCRTQEEVFKPAVDGSVAVIQPDTISSDRWLATRDLPPYPGDLAWIVTDIAEARGDTTGQQITLPLRTR